MSRECQSTLFFELHKTYHVLKCEHQSLQMITRATNFALDLKNDIIIINGIIM